MNPLDEDDDDEFAFDEPEPAERDLSPEIPSVENYEERFAEPDLASNISDVDDRTLRTFVASVLLANVALLAVSLGLMLVYFQGRWRVGGGLVGVGLLAALRLYQHYRGWQRYRERRDDGEADRAATDTDPGSE